MTNIAELPHQQVLSDEYWAQEPPLETPRLAPDDALKFLRFDMRSDGPIRRIGGIYGQMREGFTTTPLSEGRELFTDMAPMTILKVVTDCRQRREKLGRLAHLGFDRPDEFNQGAADMMAEGIYDGHDMAVLDPNDDTFVGGRYTRYYVPSTFGEYLVGIASVDLGKKRQPDSNHSVGPLVVGTTYGSDQRLSRIVKAELLRPAKIERRPTIERGSTEDRVAKAPWFRVFEVLAPAPLRS